MANQNGPESRTMGMCHFDFEVTDSDFKLPDYITDKCKISKEVEEETEEVLEEDEVEEETETVLQIEKPKDYRNKNVYCRCEPPPEVLPEDLYYKGLPAGEKKYRTDYPRELRLKNEFIPHPVGKFKTVDNYETEPIASFSPVSSKITISKDKVPSKDAFTTSSEENFKTNQRAGQNTKTYRDPPPIASVSDIAVVTYLQDYNIQMLFEYFLSLCVLHKPENPFEYIADLADKLIKGRSGEEAFREIPRLLGKNHIESMFRLYDRVESGFISYNQYKNAMSSMGVVKYNEQPDGYLYDEITKETFVAVANQAIDDLLRTFLQKQIDAKKSKPDIAKKI